MKTLKLLFLIVILPTLYACSTLNTGTTEYGMSLDTHHLSWPERQKQLMALQTWSAQGDAAAHSDTKGWNASFSWQQTKNDYAMQLFGPLGLNRMQLTGDPSQSTLKTGSQTFTAPNAELLLQQQTGWQLPVADLNYWLRGLPAPQGSKFKRSFDLNNHIVHLNQQGWDILYLRYVSVKGIDLPDRILLSNPQWQVHLVVRRWQLDQ